MTTLLLLLALARADDGSPPRFELPSPVDRADHFGVSMFKAGVVIAAIGMPLDGIGRAAPSDGLRGVGMVGEYAGVSMMTFGTLRSRRALVRSGASITPTAGYLAASLFGASILGDVAALNAGGSPTRRKSYNTIGAGLRIGAALAAVGQAGANDTARAKLYMASAPAGASLAFGVSATASSAGLTVSAAF